MGSFTLVLENGQDYTIEGPDISTVEQAQAALDKEFANAPGAFQGGTGLGFANSQIVDAAGAFVDIASLPFRELEHLTGLDLSGEKPFGGSESIRSGVDAFNSVVPSVAQVDVAPANAQPTTIGQAGMQGLGMGASVLFPGALGVKALNNFAIAFHDKAQNAMRRRMLGPKVKVIVFDFNLRHRHLLRRLHREEYIWHLPTGS